MENDLNKSLQKSIRNTNILTISILLVHTLDIEFDSLNVLGQATFKIGSPKNVEVWIWIFFSYYSFRFLQRLSENIEDLKIRFNTYTRNLSLVKLFYGKNFRDEKDGGKEHLIEELCINDNKYVFKYTDRKTGEIVESYYKTAQLKAWVVRILIFPFSVIINLLTRSNYLTVASPFIGYSILLLYFEPWN